MKNEPRLISLNEIADLTTLSRSALNKYRLAGEFPEEVSLGEKRFAFVREEVHAWIQFRIDARKDGRRFRILPPLNDNTPAEEVAA